MFTKHSKKILLVLLMTLCSFVQAQEYSEYEVKAAYMEKFTRFIDWPDSVLMEDVAKPFILGIIGKSPINSILEKMYAKHKIKNRKVEIRIISGIEEIAGCHLLYISQSEYKRIDQILGHVHKMPVLTVCDDKRYSKKGIHITLFVENEHIFFEINQDAVNQSGIYMNTLLLKMSKTVN